MGKSRRTLAPYRQTKRLKASERERIILDAAKAIIVNEGFSKFSLRYAAERSGVRLATVQYYFETKDKLFRSAFEDAIRVERQRIEQCIESAGDSADAVLRARLLGHYKANLRKETSGFFFELWARARMDEFAAKLIGEFYASIIGVVAKLISARNPDLASIESNRRATVVVSALEGLMMIEAVGKHIKRKPAIRHEYVVDTMMYLIDREA